ncbi:hypothetical protein D9M70_494930 [compost metagenome]
MQRRAEFPGFRVHVGIGRSRLDVVHGDAARPQVARHALHQPQQRGLAHRIRAAAGERHPLGIGAADVDDAAALAHVRQRCPGRDEHRAHVDGQGLVKVFQRQRLDRSQPQHAGIVDQDVELAELARGTVDGAGQRGGIGGVGLQRQRAAAGGFHFRGQRVGPRCGVLVGEGDGGALARQPAHDCRADAAGAAGYECSFSSQVGHGLLREMVGW